MKTTRLIYPFIFICSFWIASAETTALREAEAKRTIVNFEIVAALSDDVLEAANSIEVEISY